MECYFKTTDAENYDLVVSHLERNKFTFRCGWDPSKHFGFVTLLIPKKGMSRFLRRHGKFLGQLGFPRFQE